MGYLSMLIPKFGLYFGLTMLLHGYLASFQDGFRRIFVKLSSEIFAPLIAEVPKSTRIKTTYLS